MYIDNVCYVHVVIFITVTTSGGTAVICCRVTAPKFIFKKNKRKKKKLNDTGSRFLLEGTTNMIECLRY